MLAEQRAVRGVHQEPERPRDADAHLARLVHAPEREHEREQIRHAAEVLPGQEVEGKRRDHARRHEAHPDRQQDVLRVRGHHSPLRALRFARAPFFGRSDSDDQAGVPAAGASTRTWWWRVVPATGRHTILANAYAASRSTLAILATGRPRG